MTTLEFPLSEVSDIGSGVVTLEPDSDVIWLRLGFHQGDSMPDHWRAARLTKEHARQLGDALLTLAAQP